MGLTSVTITDSVTSIGYRAFYGCSKLTICRIEPDENGAVIIPNEWKSILAFSFYQCTSLTSVTIPDSVTSIGDGAFSECSGLNSVTIPDSVTSIGYDAFRGCSCLTSVTIPDGVTS